MEDHATIFYAKPVQHYALCYDDDLEALPKPTREQAGCVTTNILMVGQKSGLCLPAPYEIQQKEDGSYLMRVRYKPVHTEHIINEDGYVDRFVSFQESWLSSMCMQFDMVFPAGLPIPLIKQVIIPEV